jgi:hypothetical protein
MMARVPPTRIVGITDPMPPMWNRGVATKLTSSSPPSWKARMMLRAWAWRLRCDKTAPLGRPVVPDVYMISAGDEPDEIGQGKADVRSGHLPSHFGLRFSAKARGPSSASLLEKTVWTASSLTAQGSSPTHSAFQSEAPLTVR